MSVRLGGRSIRNCYQSMRVASQMLKPKMQSVNRMSEMRFRRSSFANELETMSKRFNKFENCCRMRPSELQRVQCAITTSLLFNMSSTVLSLCEVLSGVSCEEEEEGSSTGVRRTRGQ